MLEIPALFARRSEFELLRPAVGCFLALARSSPVSTISTINRAPAAGYCTAEFLELIPIVERQVRFAFRGRSAADREEAAAEAVAAAYESYVKLTARGKNPARNFPSAFAAYAILHVKAGHHVGSSSSSTDVLSPRAWKKRGFRVEPLSGSPGVARDPRNPVVHRRPEGDFDEQLRDNTRSPVPDQAAFRVDFPTFLAGLGQRDRELVKFLALGHSAHSAATRFKLSEGRVCQLRKTWRERWCQSQDECVDDRSKPGT